MEKMTLEEARALAKADAERWLEMEDRDMDRMGETIRRAGQRYQAELASGSPATTGSTTT